MEPNLLIKYSEQPNGQVGYDLGLLGESFSGFNEVIKEIVEISKIEGDLVIRTTKVTEGSIDVFNLIYVVVTHIPFKEIKELLDFLQVADNSLHQNAENFFNAIGHGHKTVNDWFKENQFDNTLLNVLLTIFVTRMLDHSGNQKYHLTLEDEYGNKISEMYAKKLKNMITSGKYKRALKPVSENSVASVKIFALNKQSDSVVIDENKLENYLPDEEEILPDLKNGSVHSFDGEILALQNTKGDTLRFKTYGIESRFQLLTVHPADGTNTEDYKDYYKKQVQIKAEIFRKTLYKKPELILREISLLQEELI